MNARWDQIRGIVLTLLLAGVAAALLAAKLQPQPLERLAPSFPFGLPPAHWTVDDAFAITEHDSRGFAMRAGYRTGDSRAPMTIRMRYTPDIRNLYEGGPEVAAAILPSGYLPLDIGMGVLIDTRGRLRSNARIVNLGDESAELRRKNGIGSYVFWNDDGKIHLSAILRAGRPGVVTRQEFSKDLYGEMARMGSLARGFLGLAPLPDPRSVIVDLSMSTTAGAPEAARRQLEEAWFQWQPWCKQRFPRPSGYRD